MSFYLVSGFFWWSLCVAATSQWPYPGFPLPLQLPSCAVILPTHSLLTMYQPPQTCHTPLRLQNLAEVQPVTSSANHRHTRAFLCGEQFPDQLMGATTEGCCQRAQRHIQYTEKGRPRSSVRCPATGQNGCCNLCVVRAAGYLSTAELCIDTAAGTVSVQSRVGYYSAFGQIGFPKSKTPMGGYPL